MIDLFLTIAAKPPSIPGLSQGLQSSDHALLMGLAGIICGALLIYAILSQL